MPMWGKPSGMVYLSHTTSLFCILAKNINNGAEGEAEPCKINNLI